MSEPTKEIDAAGAELAKLLLNHTMLNVLVSSTMMKHRIPHSEENCELVIDAVVQQLARIRADRRLVSRAHEQSARNRQRKEGR